MDLSYSETGKAVGLNRETDLTEKQEFGSGHARFQMPMWSLRKKPRKHFVK